MNNINLIEEWWCSRNGSIHMKDWTSCHEVQSLLRSEDNQAVLRLHSIVKKNEIFFRQRHNFRQNQVVQGFWSCRVIGLSLTSHCFRESACCWHLANCLFSHAGQSIRIQFSSGFVWCLCWIFRRFDSIFDLNIPRVNNVRVNGTIQFIIKTSVLFFFHCELDFASLGFQSNKMKMVTYSAEQNHKFWFPWI